jgi:hypothetical protein
LIQHIKKLKQLPYKLYIAVLLKNEEVIEKAKELDMDGYVIITSSPKMVMLFVEYQEGMPTKVSKDVWQLM